MAKAVKEVLDMFNTEMAEDITPPDVKPEDKGSEENKDTADSDTKDTPEDKKEEESIKDKPSDEKEKEPEKEPKKPEDKKDEPENKPDERVNGLEAEIERLKGELAKAQDNNDSKVELDQANTLLSVQKGMVVEYEGILNGIIDAKLQEVPENIKELVPNNLSLKEKLDWIAKAEKSGILKQANTDIEIGKPLNPNNVKQTTDTAKLSASAIMALAYGNSKGKGKK